MSLFFGHAFPVTLDGTRAILRANEFFEKLARGEIDMRKPYIGMNLYLPPIFLVTGPSKLAFQAAQTLFMTLTVVCTFLFTKKMFNIKTAVLSSAILVFLPIFIMLRWNEQPFLAFTLMVVMLFGYKFYKTGRDRFLFLAGFFSGLAIFLKLTAVYFLASMFLSYLVLRRFWKIGKIRISKKQVALFSVFFLLGVTPLIWHNVHSDWETVSFLKKAGAERGGSAFLNIPLRFQHLLMAVQGISSNYPVENLFTVIFPLNAILLVLAVVLVIHRKDARDLFILLMIFFFIFFSSFVPPPTPPNVIHLYYILPLAGILISRLFIFIKEKSLLVFVLILLVFFSLNLYSIYSARNKLTNETWIEDNFPRAAKVHSEIFSYIEPGTVVMLPWIEILGVNIDYLRMNRRDFSREVICEEYFANHECFAECDVSEIEKVIKQKEGKRILFVIAPMERKSYWIYEQNCESNQSLCSAPVFSVEVAVKNLGKTMERTADIRDSRNESAYDIYLIT